MEEWRDIPGFEKCYQVSDLGRVRSVDREQLRLNCHGKMSLRKDKGKILKPSKMGGNSGKGDYLFVILAMGKDNIKPHYIHRLVTMAFIPNPENKPTIDHINRDDKLDNRVSNLKWATLEEQYTNRGYPPGLSGQRYIYQDLRNLRYYVRVTGVKGSFKTLPEAIEARDKYLNELSGDL